MELRQLRYFVALADELHFGRAAAREHIVQSALSQQIQRLERELGVALVERTTHHVCLTQAGDIFVAEARQILSHVERASAAAKGATSVRSVLRVAVGDANLDTMPMVLRAVRARLPHLVIHQVEASVPQQFQLITAGRIDVGIGRASHAPPAVASELLRLDPMGVLVDDAHRFARLEEIPVRILAEEEVLFAEADRAPEFNEFVSEMCRSAGFTPTVHRETVESVRGAAELVRDQRCVTCVPRSCGLVLDGVRWVPLTEPPSYYRWSLLWRAGEQSGAVKALLACARRLAAQQGWLHGPDAVGAVDVASPRR